MIFNWKLHVWKYALAFQLSSNLLRIQFQKSFVDRRIKKKRGREKYLWVSIAFHNMISNNIYNNTCTYAIFSFDKRDEEEEAKKQFTLLMWKHKIMMEPLGAQLECKPVVAIIYCLKSIKVFAFNVYMNNTKTNARYMT